MDRRRKQDERAEAPHSALLLVGTAGAFLTYLAMITLNTLGSNDWGSDVGVFKNNTGDISDLYYLEITPSGATFSIWGAIYVWNAILLLYAMANLCRRTEMGPVYVAPGPLPVSFFLLYMFNNAANVAWLLLWDSQYIEASCFMLWVVSVSIYVMMAVVARNVNNVRNSLQTAGLSKDYWFVQAFVMNGLGIYVGWTSCAMNLNVAHALIYGKYTAVPQPTGCTIALAILATLLVGYAVADFALLDRWTRYLMTPYIPVVAALSGSIVKNWNPDKRNSIFTAVLLSLAVLFFIVKLILTIVRHRKQHRRQFV